MDDGLYRHEGAAPDADTPEGEGTELADPLNGDEKECRTRCPERLRPHAKAKPIRATKPPYESFFR